MNRNTIKIIIYAGIQVGIRDDNPTQIGTNKRHIVGY